MRKILVCLLVPVRVLVLALFFVPLAARADLPPGPPPQPTQPTTPPAPPSDKWEPVSGMNIQAPGESIPASGLVGGAYAFIWLMVAGFVATVWWRQASVTRELADLQKKIAAADKQR